MQSASAWQQLPSERDVAKENSLPAGKWAGKGLGNAVPAVVAPQFPIFEDTSAEPAPRQPRAQIGVLKKHV